MKITNNSYVSITLEMRENDKNGQILESYPKDDLLSFFMGDEFDLKRVFEKHLMGLEVGEKFEFTITPEDAFGYSFEDLIIEIPKSAISNSMGEEDIKVGTTIIATSETGEENFGRIILIDDKTQTVTIDFNHPYANMNLYLCGEVVEISDDEDLFN